EVPFVTARPRPKASDGRAKKERLAWEDTRIALGYPPEIASPGRRRAFEIPTGCQRGQAQRPRSTLHRALLPVRVRPRRALSPRPHSRTALCTQPPRPDTERRFRLCPPAAPLRPCAPKSFALFAFVPNERTPGPDCATSSLPHAPASARDFAVHSRLVAVEK